MPVPTLIGRHLIGTPELRENDFLSFRVQYEILQSNPNVGDHINVIIGRNMFTITVINWSLNQTEIPIDRYGNRRDVSVGDPISFYEIEGIIENQTRINDTDEDLHQDQFGSVHTIVRNPQTQSDSISIRTSSPAKPLTAPPGGMLTNEVICKYCRQRFAYPLGKDVDYFTKWSDVLGLVTCRACYNYQNGLEEGEGTIEKPKKKKNLYSRKLRIRRKK